jgi:hypothetical protein
VHCSNWLEIFFISFIVSALGVGQFLSFFIAEAETVFHLFLFNGLFRLTHGISALPFLPE